MKSLLHVVKKTILHHLESHFVYTVAGKKVPPLEIHSNKSTSQISMIQILVKSKKNQSIFSDCSCCCLTG